MPNIYKTQAEQWILSFIAGGPFQVEDRQLYHDHVSPKLIQELLKTYDYEDALAIMNYVIDRVETRYDRAKDRLTKYELACYRSWLMNIRGQIAADYHPDRSETRHMTVMEAIKRILRRQQAHT